MTIIEMAITVVILSGIAVVIGSVLDAGLGAFESTSPSVVEQQAHRTVDKIAERLAFAGASTLIPEPVGEPDGSALTFRSCLGSDEGVQTWGIATSIQFRAEPGDPRDGKDNDGDGFIDEGTVVLFQNYGEPNQSEVVLAHGVARLLEGELPNGTDDNGNGLVDEPGLLIEIDGRAIRIHLTLVRLGRDGQVITRTAHRTLALRN